MKKQAALYFLFAISILTILRIPNAMAHCPLCTAAAGSGVGIARAYGLDDSIVGLMLGALIASSALWVDKLIKKKYKIPYLQVLLVAISFLLLVAPLYYKGFYTNFEMVKSMPEQHGMTGLGVLSLTQFGIDKLLWGTIIGTFAIWLTFTFSEKIKIKNNGKRLFPFQGLIFMVGVLLILSFLLYAKAKFGV